MIKRLTLLLTLLTSTWTGWCQMTITGTVIDKPTNSPLPQVIVVEKGTRNGTATAADGTFSLKVSDSNSTLIFSFIGYIPQEYSLKGQTQISITLREDCIKDFFDSNRVDIYFSSGVINNPIGGQIEIASPYVLGGVIKGRYGYQTNLDENEFQNGEVELSHFISNCEFDVDFKINYRQVSFENHFDSKAYSLETDLNISRFKFIGGYSHLDFKRLETVENQTSSGPLVGLGVFVGKPFYSTVVGKVSLYKNNIEYQGYIQSSYRAFCYFVKFYKLDSFNELSLGVGRVIGYRLRKQQP